jgi:hypothetical protein
MRKVAILPMQSELPTGKHRPQSMYGPELMVLSSFMKTKVAALLTKKAPINGRRSPPIHHPVMTVTHLR